MKVIPSNSPGKPWRVIVPGRYNPDDNGKRKRKPFYFETKDEGQKFIKNLKTQGRNALRAADSDDVAVIRLAREKLGGDLSELFKAVNFYLANRPRQGALTVREAVNQFLAAQESKGYAPVTIDDNRAKLKKFLAAFEARAIGELTRGDLIDWLSAQAAGTTRRGIYKTMKTLFSWTVEREILTLSPMKFDPLDDWGSRKGLINPDYFHRLLVWSQTHDHVLLAFLCLGGFFGLRSRELARNRHGDESIKWEDIKWERRFLHIREEVAKQTSRESGNERYPSNELSFAALEYWLKPFALASGYVIPSKVQTLRLRLKKALAALAALPASDGGAKLEIPENGLRNSFMSYYLTAREGAGVGELAREAGNSEEVARKYYIKALEPKTGVAWFAVPKVQALPAAPAALAAAA